MKRFREQIDLKRIADAMGMDYTTYEDRGQTWQRVTLGPADWAGDGHVVSLDVEYFHGARGDTWRQSCMKDRELTYLCGQVLGSWNMNEIMTNDRAWAFFAALNQIQKDIASWRREITIKRSNETYEALFDTLSG